MSQRILRSLKNCYITLFFIYLERFWRGLFYQLPNEFSSLFKTTKKFRSAFTLLSSFLLTQSDIIFLLPFQALAVTWNAECFNVKHSWGYFIICCHFWRVSKYSTNGYLSSNIEVSLAQEGAHLHYEYHM